MMWLDFLLQSFVQALAWCLAAFVAVVIIVVVAKIWAAFGDWSHERARARRASGRGSLFG